MQRAEGWSGAGFREGTDAEHGWSRVESGTQRPRHRVSAVRRVTSVPHPSSEGRSRCAKSQEFDAAIGVSASRATRSRGSRFARNSAGGWVRRPSRLVHLSGSFPPPSDRRALLCRGSVGTPSGRRGVRWSPVSASGRSTPDKCLTAWLGRFRLPFGQTPASAPYRPASQPVFGELPLFRMRSQANVSCRVIVRRPLVRAPVSGTPPAGSGIPRPSISRPSRKPRCTPVQVASGATGGA